MLDLQTDPDIGGRISAPSADYPNGASVNETGPGNNDGTPYIAKRANDVLGLLQGLLYDSGQLPSGVPETAIDSQALRAMGDLFRVGFKNKIINGNFELWQRGTVFAPGPTATYTADRWAYVVTADGGALNVPAIGRQPFPFGQTDAPGAEYFCAFAGNVIGGTGNEAITLLQRIESADTLSNEKAVLSFVARSQANEDAAIFFEQSFGTGGGESPAVFFGAENISLTTNWQQFEIVVDVPDVAGKGLGANGDDWLGVHFADQIGATRAASLGIAPVSLSTDFQVANVQLERGRYKTPFERLPSGVNENLCFRYYQQQAHGGNNPGHGRGVASGAIVGGQRKFNVSMRATPTVIPLITVVVQGRILVGPSLNTAGPTLFAAGSRHEYWIGIDTVAGATGADLYYALNFQGLSALAAFDAEL